MKPLGMTFYAIGTVLVLVLLIWGRAGVYTSQLGAFFALGAVGVAAIFVGARLNKEKDPNKAVAWKPSEALQSAGGTTSAPESADDAGEMMNCPNCGTPTRTGAGFCGNCGAKLEVVPSVPVSTLAPPPPPPTQASPPPLPPPPPPPPPPAPKAALPQPTPDPVVASVVPEATAEEAGPVNPDMITLPPGLISPPPAAAEAARPSPSMAEAVFITSPGTLPPALPPAEDLDATRVSARRRTGSPWRLVLPDGQHYVVDGTVLIGRDPAARVKWPSAKLLPLNDTTKSVSKTHAVLEADDSGLWITDLKSTNGVVVTTPEGQEVDGDGGGRLRVEPGADIELGDYVIQVEKD